MKEYEISSNNKVLGKVNIFSDNIKNDLNNSLIVSEIDLYYEKLKINSFQKYEIEYVINDIDELFNIVSKYIYDKNKVFESIEEIKKYNNIKNIKKGTKINILVPLIYLQKLGFSKDDIDLQSLFLSKVYFVKETITNLKKDNYIDNLNNLINQYNNYINSNEYEFLTYDEKEENIKNYINKIDKFIEEIEYNTNYKYGKDYIVPIKISNNKF